MGAMTEAAFAELVGRLEQASASRPRWYRRRVLLGAMLGYGYVFSILAVALAVLGLLGLGIAQGHGRVALLKLGVPVAGLVAMVVRGLWVRLEEPEGVPLEATDAPPLFETIHKVRGHVRAHRVLLTDDFNAAVVQVPRLGALGWQKNFLLLGLPLMQALSPAQFEAVLAHEFGHLSGSHGKLGGWIYRVRAGWDRIVGKMEEEEHWGSFLFLPFFRWYAPWFAAYSFVLARQQEYEADRDGVEIASGREMADALCSLPVRGDFLEDRYWPGVYRAADRVARPAVGPHESMRAALREGPRPEDAQASLAAALDRPTTLADTHPCLSDRLAALGEEPRVPPASEASAAAALLGAALPKLAGALDARWKRHVDDWWTTRHEYVREATARLAELDGKEEKEPLDLDDAWEQAQLREEFEGADHALVLYQSLLHREPALAGAQFAVGRILLGREDASGLDHLDSAMKLAEDAIFPGCELAFHFLHGQGRAEDAERYRERAIAQREKLDRAEAERSTLPTDDRYLPHGVSEDALAALREALAAHPKVVSAWLVRRDLEFYPERPLFALGVQQKKAFRKQKQADLALQAELVEAVPLPGESFVLVVNHCSRKERRIFTQVAGSQILG
jgi:Zn-dependent protease with chaperone function